MPYIIPQRVYIGGYRVPRSLLPCQPTVSSCCTRVFARSISQNTPPPPPFPACPRVLSLRRDQGCSNLSLKIINTRTFKSILKKKKDADSRRRPRRRPRPPPQLTQLIGRLLVQKIPAVTCRQPAEPTQTNTNRAYTEDRRCTNTQTRTSLVL